MQRRSLFGLALGLFLLPVSALAENAATLTDTTRVVAVGGSVTEIIYALGAGDRLIARDSTSVYPPEAMSLPDVGYMRQLSPEGILSVNPTGIIALQGSGPKDAVDVLKKASVPYVEIEEAFDHAGILAKVRAVGQALGQEGRAEELAGEVDAKLKSAEATTANVVARKRVLFILSMQGGKILASGSDTAADGMIKLAGAVNAVEGFAGYKQLSDEAAIVARPDVILMMDRAGAHAMTPEQLFAHPALAPTPAAAGRKLVRMDGAYLLGFGPRTADAIRDLAVSLYGDEVAH